MRHRVLRAIIVGLVVMAATALFALARQPAVSGMFATPWDKLAHLIYFGGMAGALRLALPSCGALWLFALFAAVGAADEIHQIFIPGRQAGLDDFAADVLGAALGLVIFCPCMRRDALPAVTAGSPEQPVASGKHPYAEQEVGQTVGDQRAPEVAAVTVEVSIH